MLPSVAIISNDSLSPAASTESDHRNPTISPPNQCWHSFRCICQPEVRAGAETIPNTLNLTQRKLVEYLRKKNIRVYFGDMAEAVHGNCPTYR